jgi:hypothetical protein
VFNLFRFGQKQLWPKEVARCCRCISSGEKFKLLLPLLSGLTCLLFLQRTLMIAVYELPSYCLCRVKTNLDPCSLIVRIVCTKWLKRSTVVVIMYTQPS